MLGLARLVEAGVVGAEEPAMIAAANTFLLDLAIEQGRAAMHAAGIEQARPALLVAKQNQILAEDSDIFGPGRRLFGQGDRQPIAPEQFAYRLPGPDLGQEPVGLGGLATIGGTPIDLAVCCGHR